MEVEEPLKHTNYVIFDAIIRSWQNFSITLTGTKQLQTLIWLPVSVNIDILNPSIIRIFNSPDFARTLSGHWYYPNILQNSSINYINLSNTFHLVSRLPLSSSSFVESTNAYYYQPTGPNIASITYLNFPPIIPRERFHLALIKTQAVHLKIARANNDENQPM